MKRFYTFFLILFMLSTAMQIAHAENEADWMPDTHLRAAVRAKLGLADDEALTQATMADLTNLYAPQSNIESLTGLEHATGLTKLIVWQNSINDITPVTDLTSLTDFRIGGNSVSGITPVANLTNLTHLAMQRNQITDIASLSGLVKLEWLRLVGNRDLTDTSPIAWLPNLTDVDVDIPPAVKIENVPKAEQTGPFDVTITFSETVTGNPSSAFLTLSGDATATVTGSEHTDTTNYPNSFAATITPTSRGELMFNVPADVVTDSDNIPNTASETHTLQVEPALVVTDIDTRDADPDIESQPVIVDVTIWMPDANLRAAVREALEIEADATFTQDDVSELTELTASSSEIGDLTGLEHATNLTTLNLASNAITDISALSGLTNLQTLYLHDNDITDISPLSSLVNLLTLIIEGNDITDVSPLAGIPNVSIEVPAHIPDPALAGAVRSKLGLDADALITLTDLQTLTEFVVPVAFNSKVKDLTGLEHATNLTTFRIANSKVTDLSPLSGLTNLRELDLNSNKITDISPLSELTGLTKLDLNFNMRLTNIGSLTKLTALTELNLMYTNVRDLSALSGMTALTDLRLLSGAPLALARISDISALAGLTSLKVLYSEAQDISDITAVAALTNLTTVKLGGNDITDISALSGLTKLTTLELHANNITDVSALSGLENLQTLKIADNDIADLSPVAFVPDVDVEIAPAVKIENVPQEAQMGAFNVIIVFSRGVTFDLDNDLLTLGGDATATATVEQNTDPDRPHTFIATLTPTSSGELTFNVPAGVVMAGPDNLLNTASETYTLQVEPAPITTEVQPPIQNVEDWMPEANLRAAVREALEVGADATFTQDDVSELTELTAALSEISDLTGLEHATNLTALYLHYNDITDISALSGLTKLTTLDLQNNQITDISALSGLTKLTTLYLHYNDITDISPLSSLINLQTLIIEGNDITDVSPLAGISNVSIEVPAHIPDPALAGAVRTRLDLDAEAPITLADLQTLTEFVVPVAFNSKVKDLTGLEHATNLTTFRIANSKVTDLSPLSGLTNLTELDIASNKITDLSPLSELTGLTKLDLNFNTRLRNIEPLTKLTALTELNLMYTNVRDLSALSGMTALTDLRLLSGAPLALARISDISALAGLTSLKVLYSEAQDISDISALAALTSLTTVKLGGNDITDISALSGLTKLQTLTLVQNPILDTSPLYALTQDNLTDVDITISQYPPWDVNADGSVDADDELLVTTALGQTGDDIADPRTDVNADGTVDNADLLLVTDNLDEAEALAPSRNSIASLLDRAMLESLDPEALAAQLAILHAESDGSLKYLRAIGLLESLLAALQPEETRLLANYPNPFNPETWIPYQLATAGKVRITIYDTQGKVVRRLDLGHQREGYYTNRSRAAYWDGRNSVGERVASGIYFYQLQTDDASYLRKLVILK